MCLGPAANIHLNTSLNERLLGISTPRAALLLSPSLPLALPPPPPSFTPTGPPGVECQTQPDQKLCRHAATAEAVPLAPCGESHLQLAVLPTDVRACLQAAPHRRAPRRRCAHHEVGGMCVGGAGGCYVTAMLFEVVFLRCFGGRGEHTRVPWLLFADEVP